MTRILPPLPLNPHRRHPARQSTRPLFALHTLVLFSTLLFVASDVIGQERPEFRRALPGYPFSFPRDHGSHPDFKLEWWYLTGHLKADQPARRFGFQATFFRAALQPTATSTPGSTPAFGHRQAFLAHIALLDVTQGQLYLEERLNRQGWDASASTDDLHVTNGNWTLKRVPSPGHPETMELHASVLADAKLSLTLTPAKPKVIFGEDGVSRKSSVSDAASHYITFSRLHTSGSIWLEGTRFDVEGTAWMDHEFSSSQLGPQQVGWDWASIQLHDGREIMLYRLRLRDGTSDPASKLTWIDSDSRQWPVAAEDWEWSARTSWTSPHTGATYPQDFGLRTLDPETGKSQNLRLRPLMEDQEIAAKLDAISYWEGACDVLDADGSIVGQAYVELAGYHGKLAERLR